MKIRLAVALLAAVPLSACASSALTVEQPIRAQVRGAAVNLTYGESTVDISPEAVSYLNERMNQEFFTGDTPLRAGNDVTIRYRFVAYEKGSRAARYFGGGLLGGKAKMVIEAEFLSASGERIGLVRSEGEVAGGAFGGSHNSAIDKAVKEIRDYARTNLTG
jgi:hypothetical protein